LSAAEGFKHVTQSKRTGLILAVDDEPMILRAISAALAFAGFSVIVAENGIAGLEAFSQSPKAIDLVLVDIAMPILGGLEMSERIRKIRPEIPILLMTAYSPLVISTVADIRYPLIRKPFLLDDLIRAVSENIEPPSVANTTADSAQGRVADTPPTITD
jgi:DNA-binding NtrC family response regulator